MMIKVWIWGQCAPFLDEPKLKGEALPGGFQALFFFDLQELPAVYLT
jgi:hypothetical protein